MFHPGGVPIGQEDQRILQTSVQYICFGIVAMKFPSLCLSGIGYHLRTVFLFTKHDVLPAIIHVTLFSIASAPLHSPTHITRTVLWIWLHTLQCGLAKQIKALDEGKANKSSRLIPAGRISIREATFLRWPIALLCLLYSSLYSIQLLFSSIGLQLFAVWYNEMDGDKNWLSKNVVLAFMYGYAELGGTLIAGGDTSRLSDTGKLAIQLTVAVYASTVHCQDFKDVKGNLQMGRRTVPVAFPIASRLVVGFCLPMWSYLLCCIWKADRICTLVYVAYGCFVGGRFLLLWTQDADKQSCTYYSIWFSLQHLLPGHWNYFHGNEGSGCDGFLQSAWRMFRMSSRSFSEWSGHGANATLYS